MHPNRLPFKGVLTFVNVASDKAPSGAKGHRVVIGHRAALLSLQSLIGMAVNYSPGWTHHDPQRKIGIIENAFLADNRIEVAGFLYARDWPVTMKEIREFQDDLGMSWDAADAHIEDMNAKVWRIDRLTFLGAAIMFRDRAAYKETSFRLEESCSTR